MIDFKLNHRNAKKYKIGTKLIFLLFIAFIAFIVINCGSNSASTDTVPIINFISTAKTINGSRAIQYRNAKPTATLKDIRTQTGGWSKNPRPNFEQSFSPHVFWFKVPLRNRTGQSVWYGTLNNTRLNYVNFYLTGMNNTQTYKTGDYRPLPGDAVLSYPAFRFKLAPEQEAILYIRIETNTNISFSLNFYGSEAFGEHISRRWLIHWLYAGMLLLYLLFQVRFNPAVKGVLEIYLSGIMIMTLFYFFCFFGEANRLLWPNSIYAKNTMVFIFNIAGQFFLILFAGPYLKIPQIAPRLYKLFMIQTTMVGLLIPVMFIISSNYVRTLILSALIILNFSLIFCGIFVALRKRYFWVLFLAASWIFFALAGVIFALTFFGLVPYNFFTANIVLWLFPLDAVTLTISLIYRHRNLTHDRDLLRQKIDDLMEKTSQTVTPEVGVDSPPLSRTVDLKTKTDQRSRRLQSLDSSRLLDGLIAFFKTERPYLEEDLSLAQVAAGLEIRPDQLSAVLNKEMNTSFSGLVNEYRIREACHLMQEKPEMNLLTIAFECGFGSRASFNRVFKQNMDLAPAEYRRRLSRVEFTENPA